MREERRNSACATRSARYSVSRARRRLDEQQRTRTEPVAPAVDDRRAGAAYYIQPLIGATVAVARIAFGVARREHHLCALRAPVTERHAETFAESQLLALQLTLSLLTIGNG